MIGFIQNGLLIQVDDGSREDQMFKKSLITVMIVVLMALALSGCTASPGQAGGFETENVVGVRKDGSIMAVMVESFDEAYYQIGELEQMITAEVADYNADKGVEAIWVDQVATQNGLVNVRLKFADPKTYGEYTDSFFFSGTISEAIAQNIDLNQTLHNPLDAAQTIGANEISAMEKSWIMICDAPAEGPVLLETYGTVSYVGDGVSEGRNNKSVRCESSTNGLVYVIFE